MDHKDFEYSIMIRQHRRTNGGKYLMGIKQDGIDESAKNLKLIATKKQIIEAMAYRIKVMINNEMEEE